jgi:hypothetical protein
MDREPVKREPSNTPQNLKRKHSESEESIIRESSESPGPSPYIKRETPQSPAYIKREPSESPQYTKRKLHVSAGYIKRESIESSGYIKKEPSESPSSTREPSEPLGYIKRDSSESEQSIKRDPATPVESVEGPKREPRRRSTLPLKKETGTLKSAQLFKKEPQHMKSESSDSEGSIGRELARFFRNKPRLSAPSVKSEPSESAHPIKTEPTESVSSVKGLDSEPGRRDARPPWRSQMRLARYFKRAPSESAPSIKSEPSESAHPIKKELTESAQGIKPELFKDNAQSIKSEPSPEKVQARIRVFIMTRTGKILDVYHATPESTVAEMKQWYMDHDPTPQPFPRPFAPCSPQMVFAGRLLSSDRRLVDEGIRDGSHVHVVLKSSGD